MNIEEYLEKAQEIKKVIDHMLEEVSKDLKILIVNKEMSEETVSGIQLYSSLCNVEVILEQLQELA